MFKARQEMVKTLLREVTRKLQRARLRRMRQNSDRATSFYGIIGSQTPSRANSLLRVAHVTSVLRRGSGGYQNCALLSTMRERERSPAAQKPYTLSPKPPSSVWHDAKDRMRRTRSCRALTHAARWSLKTHAAFKALLQKRKVFPNRSEQKSI